MSGQRAGSRQFGMPLHCSGEKLTMSMHFGFAIPHLLGDGHWNPMRKTVLNPHSIVTNVVACTIIRCLATGVNVVRGTSKEPFAATLKTG
jgi:hypothetical protein